MGFLIRGSHLGCHSSVTILTLQVILGKIYAPAKTTINTFKTSGIDIFIQLSNLMKCTNSVRFTPTVAV